MLRKDVHRAKQLFNHASQLNNIEAAREMAILLDKSPFGVDGSMPANTKLPLQGGAMTWWMKACDGGDG